MKQRILCLVDSSGSSYHRVKLYKDYVTEVEGKELEWVILEKSNREKKYLKEEIQEGDILFFNWMIQNQATELSLWKKELGIKILYDVDDNFRPDGYSKDHPYFRDPKHLMNTYYQIIRLASEADIVTVSTPRLGHQLLHYNQNVAVLYNFLPVGQGQFVSNKIESNKLKVGICGSVSHAPDWKLLKGAINRIAKNKELSDRIEFHICGYKQGHPSWEETLKLFTVKKNLVVNTHEALPVDSYMELYNYLDVCLIPLEEVEFSYSKSALKLSECLASKTIPVGSKIYSDKELGAICEAETPIEYEKWLEYLTVPENYTKTLDYITETNSKDNDFEGRIEGIKLVLKNVINNNYSIDLHGVKIHSIVYDTNQTTEYEAYDNSHIRSIEQKSYLFEWNPIKDIVSNLTSDTEYLGVFSWKFPNKTGYTKNILNKTLQNKEYQNYDFINLSKQYWKNTGDFLKFGYDYHPGLEERLKEVLENIGIPYEFYSEYNAYSNFYLMKTEYWKDFMTYIDKAINYMESDPKFMEKCEYKDGLSFEKLKELTGLDYYTYHTFILERIIVFYIKFKSLKCLNL